MSEYDALKELELIFFAKDGDFARQGDKRWLRTWLDFLGFLKDIGSSIDTFSYPARSSAALLAPTSSQKRFLVPAKVSPGTILLPTTRLSRSNSCFTSTAEYTPPPPRLELGEL